MWLLPQGPDMFADIAIFIMIEKLLNTTLTALFSLLSDHFASKQTEIEYSVSMKSNSATLIREPIWLLVYHK